MKKNTPDFFKNRETRPWNKLLFGLFLFLLGQISFSQTYCIPTFNSTGALSSYSGCIGGDNIDSFILQNSGINHIGSGCSPDAYGNFTNVSELKGILHQGETYGFIVTHQGNNLNVKIWIDFNSNGSFDDQGELLFNSTTLGNYASPTTGTITIPETATLTSATRLRILVSREDGIISTPSTSCTPINNWTFVGYLQMGETHDYEVSVLVPTDCSVPENVIATSTSNIINLEWGGDGSIFDLEWGEGNFIQGEGTSVSGITNNSYSLPELNPMTNYSFYLRKYCNDDEYSFWAGPFIFTTLCGPVDTFFENFNSSPSGNIVPNCWDRIISGLDIAQSITFISSDFGFEPSSLNIKQQSNDSSNATIVVLPEVTNINNETHWLRFKARVNSGTGELQVGYITDITNEATFTEVELLSISNTIYSTDDAEYTVTFPATTPSDARIAIRNPGTSNVEHYWDNVHWEIIPSCLSPKHLTVNNLTSTTANLSWQSDVTSFDIEYGFFGFTQGSGTIIEGIIDISYVLTELNPATSYQYYVRQNCQIEGYSDWSNVYSFTTLCDTVEFITENFDNYAAEFIVPNCWDRIISGAGVQQISNLTFSSGARSIYQQSSDSSDATIVILPEVSNIDAGTHWLRFKARAVNGIGYLEVGYITDITDASTFSKVMNVNINNMTFTSENSEYIVPFMSDTPSNARIAVRNSGNGMAGFYWDDVHWEPGDTCIFPINLKFNTISQSSTVLSWDSDGAIFDVEYGVEGFTFGSGTLISEVENIYTLNNLTPGTSYEYYVRRNCGNGQFSTWSGPLKFKAGAYLESIPTMLNTNPQINDEACTIIPYVVEVPEGYKITALSVQYTMLSVSPAWTSQQRSVLYSPTLEIGEDEVIEGDGVNFPGIINYNRNVTFANGATGVIEFELKAWRTEGGVDCGTSLMYVMDGSWILTPTFEPIPTCPNPPIDLSYTNITEDTIDLVWTAEEGVFQLIWGNVNFDIESEGSTVSDITSNSYTLSSLDSNVLYEYYVRRDCGAEDFGEWVGPFKFNAGYCIPSVGIIHYFTQFYTTNAIENIVNTTNDEQGYVNHTDLVIVQEAGESFNFTSNYIGGANGLKIWIDWNQNFVFDQDEEVFFLASSSSSKSGVILIPENTIPGYYRIRLRGVFGATSVPIACGNTDYGQIIDFTLNVPCDEVATPTGNAEQDFEEGNTLADLDVTGENLIWYADVDLIDVLDETTLLTNNTTYYVVNVNENCQSDVLVVTVYEVLSTTDFTKFEFGYNPNPVSEVLYLKANTEIKEVFVFNMLGQQLNLPVQVDNTQIDMTGLPSGNYVLSVTIEGVSKIFKIVKH